MGRWFANKIDLSRHAFNVRNRSAGWRVAPKRGEDLIVPGRSGSVFNSDKPADVGNLTLEMWAVGANLDGGIPADWNRRLAIRNHIDQLSRIFGDVDLLEIARTEDDSVDYGRTNLIANPSFENVLGRSIIRQNKITNSSAEYSKGQTTVRRNLIRNPSFERQSGQSVYRRNLLPNPRMMAQGPDREVRRNLILNPSFEANLKTWAGNNRADVDRVRRDIGGRGPWVARTTATSAGAVAIRGGHPDVRPSRTYAVQVKCRNVSPEPRTMQVAMRAWRPAGFTDWVNVASVPVAPNSNATLTGTWAAPANVRHGQVRLTQAGAEAGDQALWDEVCVEEGATVGRYFDGTNADRDGLRYKWNDVGGMSESIEYRTLARGYVPGSGNCLAGLSPRESLRGYQSTKVWLTGDMVNGGPLLRSTSQGSGLAPAGAQVSGSFSIRLHDSMPDDAVRQVTIRIMCYTESGDEVGPAWSTKDGDTAATETAAVDTNGWNRFTVEGAWCPPGTARVGIDVVCGGPWQAGDAAYIDCTLIERGNTVGTWFDGTSAANDTFTHEWAGDRHWSPSKQVGRSPAWWVTDDCAGVQTVDRAQMGEQSMRLLPHPWRYSTHRMRARTYVGNVKPGRAHTFSVRVRTNRSMPVRVRLVWMFKDKPSIVVNGDDTQTNVDQWHRLRITDVCPDDATGVLCTAIVAEAPEARDEVDLDSALMERTAALRPWFNGNSGDRYSWTGKRHESESIFERSQATGWAPTGTANPDLYRLSTTNATHGDHLVVATANEAGWSGFTAGADSLADRPNDPYTLAVDVWTPPDTSLTVRCGIIWKTAKNRELSRSTADTAHPSGWLRCKITADPPVKAAVAVPYCIVSGQGPDDEVRFDAAIFGFGGASDYKDGDNFSGWRWVGEKGLSESEETGPAPMYWHAWDGTLERSAAWSSNRQYSGLFVTTDDASPRISPHVPAKWDDRQMMGTAGETYTFACRIKARNKCRVRARILAQTYDGVRYIDQETTAVGDHVDLEAGQVGRVVVTGVPIAADSDATHLRPQVQVYANGGGAPPLGTGIYLDAAVLAAGESSKYIDGQMRWTRWTAGKDQSPSEVFGPARQCRAEMIAGFDTESMAGGTRAEFTVEMQIPEVYWEDTWTTVADYPLRDRDGVLALVDFRGMTAPIHDAIIEIHGSFTNLKLTDTGTGAWVRVKGRWREGELIRLNCDKWTARDGRGRSRIDQVRHGAHPRLLPITVQPRRPWPRLAVDADQIGAGSFVRIRARRRYHVA